MRVAIIGSGIIGVASAYHLLKAGHEVVLLDATTPGSGSSQVLSGKELAEREHALSQALAGGIHFPGQRRIRPDSLMSGLVTRCRALGALVVNHARVTMAMRHGTSLRAIATEQGEVEADHFLLAAGAHCGPMSGMFGTRLPVRPGKGYSIARIFRRAYPDPLIPPAPKGRTAVAP